MQCKTKKTRKAIKIVVWILLPIIAVSCYFEFYVNPQIVVANMSQIKNVATQTINDGIKDTIKQNNYDDLMNIEKDSDNKVSLISVNSGNVNKLNTDIIYTTQNHFKNIENMQIEIPIGTFTGIPILNGYGKNVLIKIVPIGTVNTKFISKFYSVGINQSCHKIFINVTISVNVLLPLYTQNVEVTSQVLLGECVIVGEIPNVYLNTDNLTNALNLIP